MNKHAHDNKTAALDEQILLDTQIPRRFWELDKDDYFGDPAAMDKTTKYVLQAPAAVQDGVSLLYRGRPESGKTFLISLLLRSLIVHGGDVLYLTLSQLSDHLLGQTADPEKFNVKFARTEFIAIDNCNSSEGVPRAALQRFIEIRKDAALPFILGTSLVHNEVDDVDVFRAAYPKFADSVYNLAHVIECKVSEFKTEKHYAKMKARVKL